MPTILALPDAGAVQTTDSLILEQSGGTKKVSALTLATAFFSEVGGESAAHAAATYQTIALAETQAHAAATYTAISDLASSSDATKGSSLVGFLQSGTGAVGRSEQSKLRDVVSVFDFMTAAQIADVQAGTGSIDCTAAFTSAQAASNHIDIPPGTYLLDNFQHLNRKVFRGAGLNNTFIKQASTGNPAWWLVSNATHNTGQAQGCQLTGVWFLGKVGSTVASFIVEALAPQVVAYSDFDIGGSGGYHTLEIKTGSAFEVYSSTFKVVQDDWDNRSGGIGSTNTGVVTGSGVYNKFWLNIAKCSNGIAISDASWDCVFEHAVSDGQQVYAGQENTIIGPTVEGWTGTAQSSAIVSVGAANVLINPHIINAPRSKVQGMGVDLNNGGGNQSTIIGLRILGQGSTLTFTGALVAATSATLTANWILDATGPYRVVFSDGSIRAVTLTNGATTATWTGVVTATASASVSYNVPPVAVQIPPGCSGAFINADCPALPYLLETAPNTAFFTSPTAATLARFSFLGDCTTITRKGITYQGSVVYDPPNLADGAGTTTTVTVTGVALGDLATVSFSLDLQGITVTAWVSAANTVSVRFQNESGGALDLASGTLSARVITS